MRSDFNCPCMNNEPKYEIRSVEGTDFIPVREIACFVGDGSYTNIHTSDNKKYRESGNLNIHYERIRVHGMHFRIGESHLINPNWVKHIDRSGNVIFFDMELRISLKAKDAKQLRFLMPSS